ncbi:MFS transporter [Penicillium odoratum]|uniref:MFS transporter n=1 Tax=Penicillium odoratum TaxID=1167516 RepID=UPI002547DABF|nr:MFS transporter [Penicillium odoratum]KAJ5745726.1 MFS transporter [Penicillium odoratum]
MLDVEIQLPDLELRRTQSGWSSAQLLSPSREILFVFMVCMTQFSTQIGLGCTLSASKIIADSFNITDPGIMSWFIAGYSLTVGTFILFFGRCGDLFGYHNFYIIGFFWTGIWSMVAGLSVYSGSVLFIFARTVQGLGPAMLLPNGLALLGAAYKPGKKKDMVFAIFGATAPNGAVIGAVFGAIFGQLAWWPWIFWSNALVCYVMAILGYFLIPPVCHVTKPGVGMWELVEELDVFGAILGVLGLVLVNVAWNVAPIVGWQITYVYVLLILGAIFLGIFLMWEFQIARKPLIPIHALSMDVSFVLGCIACGWASFGIWVYYFWKFLEDIRRDTPLIAAAQFVVPGLGGIAASCTTGYLMSRIRPGWIMLFAMIAFTLGNLLLAIAPAHQTYWALTFVSLLVTPWGMDMSFPASTVMLSNSVARKHQGMAASLVTTIVNYSISLGLGFAGTVEVHVNNGGDTLHHVLIGYRGALYMGIGLGGLGIAISLIYLLRSGFKDKIIE